MDELSYKKGYESALLYAKEELLDLKQATNDRGLQVLLDRVLDRFLTSLKAMEVVTDE